MINNVKGTKDIIGEESNGFNYIEGLLKSIAELFAYNEVKPPVLEHSEVFVRGVGEGSDVVRKEMYTFLDKGNRSVTMRPEFTAGIIRLMVQNKLLFNNELPLKVYYSGPVFRYERPQLGRYRQFHQFGVESVGHNSPYNDIEILTMAYTMLVSLGLTGVKVKINTLGDEESRNAYRNALKDYFKDKIEFMCEDCKSRYELNPLRILDCKVEEDRKYINGAPKISDYLSEASKDRFNKILKVLEQMHIPFEVDDTLVRGLDYYSETVFEFHYISSKGNNYGAIGAGGHYSHLVKELDGPDMPGIGFSFGIERLFSVLNDDHLLDEQINNPVSFYVMPIGENVQEYALEIATEMRLNGLRTEYCFDNVKLANMFKRATKKGAKYALIIGEDEMNNEEVIIKDLDKGEQRRVLRSLLDEEIEELIEETHDHENEICEGDCD